MLNTNVKIAIKKTVAILVVLLLGNHNLDILMERYIIVWPTVAATLVIWFSFWTIYEILKVKAKP